ncbi:MAG: hypothetical protein HUU38_13260 [Anaerolineales bacterium]|nr:hypothetical protein [Anaerolineales bacterium]
MIPDTGADGGGAVPPEDAAPAGGRAPVEAADTDTLTGALAGVGGTAIVAVNDPGRVSSNPRKSAAISAAVW